MKMKQFGLTVTELFRIYRVFKNGGGGGGGEPPLAPPLPTIPAFLIEDGQTGGIIL